MELDDWQKEIIEDESQYILLKKGRQIGGTMTFAEKAVKWMVEKKRSILVGSITEDQAKLVIMMVNGILTAKHKNMIKRGSEKPTQDRIRLKNGTEIRSRAVGVMGDAFRGFTTNVNWFNEMSKWPQLAFDSIMPTLLTTGGEMWGDSTPFGKQGFFWEACQNKDGLWSIYEKTSEDVIHNRKISKSWTEEKRERAIRFLKDQKKQMSTMQYNQEYLGMFIDDLRQFFPDKLVRKLQTAKRPNEISKRGYHYIGSDIGRLGDDPSTFEILRRYEDRVVHVEHQITKKTLLTQTANHIIGLHRNYNFKRIYVDAEGIGIGVFDILISDSATRRKTEALLNSKKIIDYNKSTEGTGGRTKMLKEDMYMNLLRVMEQNKIQLLDDNDIFQSFKSIQYEYTTDKRGKPFMYIFGNDSHIVEGLIRAAWCLKQKHLNLWAAYTHHG